MVAEPFNSLYSSSVMEPRLRSTSRSWTSGRLDFGASNNLPETPFRNKITVRDDHRVVSTNRKVRCKAPSHVGDAEERIVSNFAGGKRVYGGTEDRRKWILHPPWRLGTASIDRGLMAARKSHKCNETSPFCNTNTIAGIQLIFKFIAVEGETNRQHLLQNQTNRK